MGDPPPPSPSPVHFASLRESVAVNDFRWLAGADVAKAQKASSGHFLFELLAQITENI